MVCGGTEEVRRGKSLRKEDHLVKPGGGENRSWGWTRGSVSGMRQERNHKQVMEEKGINPLSTGRKWNPTFKPWSQTLRFLRESDVSGPGCGMSMAGQGQSLRGHRGGVAHTSVIVLFLSSRALPLPPYVPPGAACCHFLAWHSRPPGPGTGMMLSPRAFFSPWRSQTCCPRACLCVFPHGHLGTGPRGAHSLPTPTAPMSRLLRPHCFPL